MLSRSLTNLLTLNKENIPSKEKENQSFVFLRLELTFLVSKTNSTTPLSSQTAPVIWVQYISKGGKPYYYNKKTGKSSWDKPEQFEIGLYDLSTT